MMTVLLGLKKSQHNIMKKETDTGKSVHDSFNCIGINNN